MEEAMGWCKVQVQYPPELQEAVEVHRLEALVS